MKLTKEEAIKLHRDMWNWIAGKIKNEKDVCNIDFLKNKFIDALEIEHIKHYCFCCEYAKIGDTHCDRCPLDWNSEADDFMCMDMEYNDDGGYFKQCCNTGSWEEQYELALKIANLKEREGV